MPVTEHTATVVDEASVNAYAASIGLPKEGAEAIRHALGNWREWLEANAIDSPTTEDLARYRVSLRREHGVGIAAAHGTLVRMYYVSMAEAGVYPDIGGITPKEAYQ